MFNVPTSAPPEDKAICELVNAGLKPKQLFRAAYTFYRVALEEQLIAKLPVLVQSGLFRGMALFPGSLGSQLLPKWLGTYEAEVQALLEEFATEATCFVDIGCAEGFYLTGLARWLDIPCHGVDPDPRAQAATAMAAAENEVKDLVHLHPSVTSAIERCSGQALILIDVDGNEQEVLNEMQTALESTTSLSDIVLIVETDQSSGTSQNTGDLVQWLCKHDFTIVRIAAQNPSLRFRAAQADLSFLEQVVRGAEGRPGGQSWILAKKCCTQPASKAPIMSWA